MYAYHTYEYIFRKVIDWVKVAKIYIKSFLYSNVFALPSLNDESIF